MTIKTKVGAKSSATKMTVGSWAVVVVLFLLLLATILTAVVGWSSAGGAEVSASGFIALSLGVMFSLAIGFGLMGLLFYSSRKGYDEPPVIIPQDK